MTIIKLIFLSRLINILQIKVRRHGEEKQRLLQIQFFCSWLGFFNYDFQNVFFIHGGIVELIILFGGKNQVSGLSHASGQVEL